MLRRRLMKNGGIPEGAISGKFSVSANKLVYFSKGNLQLSAANTWKFADNQWERFGKSQLSDNHRDMFGWGTGNNPNQTSSNNSDYGTFTDWGSNAISNGGNEAGLWRTLSKDEWMYVFGINNGDKRLGATVGGTSNARWTNATINTNSTSVNGVILFPDGATFAVDEATTWGTINGSSAWGTKCTTAQWTALENKGCVFLPAAGSIVGSSMYNFDSGGLYWSSTAGESTRAYNMQFVLNRSPSLSDGYRYIRITVRLVYDIKTKKQKFVNLGLPSGTLWATMNVGASSETDYGNYYMYGMGSKTYDSTDTPYAGTEDPLDHSVDTAAQVWGGSWHMPTRAQIQELIDNTTYLWVTNYKGSGINGGTFTATNGAVLFFPAAGSWLDGSQGSVGGGGFYWGSSPNGSNHAYLLYFYDGNKDVNHSYRENGFSVRPVYSVKPKLYDYLYEDLSYGAKDTTKTAIGVCVIPGGVLPDGKARFMSLKGMSVTSPNEGGSDTYMYWGRYGSDIPSLTNFQTVVTGDTTAAGTSESGYVPKNGSYSNTPHIPSPIDYFSAYSSAGATSDLDGKANTEKILAVDNAASTAWQTAASITNTASTSTVHPAAQCCWRFNPGSTNQGDWYLPSMGELAFIIPNFNNLNAAINDVSGVQLNDNNVYWSSTEYDGRYAWYVYTSGGVNNFDKDTDYYVRAFYKL